MHEHLAATACSATLLCLGNLNAHPVCFGELINHKVKCAFTGREPFGVRLVVQMTS